MNPTVSRRLYSLTLGVVLLMTTCAGRCKRYPINWQPDVFAPVFYGWQDFTPPAPGKVRVWYPSLDGSPSGAPILSPSKGRYPLVILLHGHCSQQADHHKTWFLLPAQLARSGYVVAVPELPAIQGGGYPWDANTDAPLVEALISWMRTTWSGRAMLMPAPFTAMIGHSYGALLGGRMVAATPDQFKAFASLGGVWTEWPSSTPNPLGTLGVPAYFASGDGDIFADITPFWAAIAAPGLGAHRSVFANGNPISLFCESCSMMRSSHDQL